MEARLDELRKQNDSLVKTDIDTAALRGRIAMCKEILAFADPANAGLDAAPGLTLDGSTEGYGA